MQLISPLYSGDGQLYVPENNIQNSKKNLLRYDIAINKAKDLVDKTATLESGYAGFDDKDKITLNKTIPDNIDIIMLTDELYDLVHSDPNLKMDFGLTPTKGSSEQYPDLGTYDVGFTVEGTYDDFRAAIKLIESSARLYDIQSITFIPPDPEKEGSISKLSISAKTYFLKSQQ